MFSEGREDVNDEERARRPSTSTTDEKINEVEKMILANRRITVREVAEDLNISIGSCHSIFINDLGMRRFAAKFVPKLLNCNQKQHRMNIANEMLDSVRDDPNLLQRVITGDKAGVVHHEFLLQGRTAMLAKVGQQRKYATSGRQRSTKGNNRTGGQSNCQNGCRSTGIHVTTTQRVTGTQVSKMTINRRPRERNLRVRRPLRCLPLTPVHRQVRLQWCRERSTWNCADWGRIVFSDESRFLLCPDNRRKRVWRRPG
ncbi:hypothetical protein LAZ67_3004126 [Cordylochernes scorpioides]|uniref:Transposase Tc1-like domain-containing protein n=1 Tax=Cordylochernes scorpioides TaxID=51811 RepID=A0ABY6KA56_9ARAC|nr:hypothetical protein LAZ67_3004126 [Cordylochernes scorpioides]